jgi:D-serine deaminase-like pyridoxal phosphate-dependent protein
MDLRMDSSRELIGQSPLALDTPALLVDLDIMEANIARIVAVCRAHGVAWRPHSKAHKTPEIARMQIAAGAIGVTCAKLGEAEVMAAAGIRDILIANQIVGPIKIGRLVRLAAVADPIVCVDSVENAIELDRAFGSAGKPLRVAIEVDIGMNRAGVAPGDPVVALAQAIAGHAGLRFVGVAGWESQPRPSPTLPRRSARSRGRGTLAQAHERARRRPQRQRGELRRHGHVSLLRAATRRDRGGSRRRHFQRHALPHALSRRLCAGAHRAGDGDEPADADAHHRRRRQEER